MRETRASTGPTKSRASALRGRKPTGCVLRPKAGAPAIHTVPNSARWASVVTSRRCGSRLSSRSAHATDPSRRFSHGTSIDTLIGEAVKADSPFANLNFGLHPIGGDTPSDINFAADSTPLRRMATADEAYKVLISIADAMGVRRFDVRQRHLQRHGASGRAHRLRSGFDERDGARGDRDDVRWWQRHFRWCHPISLPRNTFTHAALSPVALIASWRHVGAKVGGLADLSVPRSEISM